MSAAPKPMLAVLADARLDDPGLVYEPKYDGIRAVIEVESRTVGTGGTGGRGRTGGKGSKDGTVQGRVPVRIWSRNGNDKTNQFPEIVEAIQEWAAASLKGPVVLDGEIVALDDKGQPLGFQALQGRIHLKQAPGSRQQAPGARQLTAGSRLQASGKPEDKVPVAFIAFDLLREGTTDLRGWTLLDRRARLELLFPKTKKSSPPGVLRLSEIARGDGRALHARAVESGWEGVIAKRADSIYHSGKRTPDWRKIKLTHQQEFVIGGWTEPRGMRSHIGALMLGVWEHPQAPGSRPRATGSSRALRYVGHVGTGFNERELARISALLRKLEVPARPFHETPPANDRPHWVRPELVAQVRFSEWTMEGLLRHPVYLGLRDDKKADDVVRETKAPGSGLQASGVARSGPRPKSEAGSPKPAAKREARSLNPAVHSLKPDRAEQDTLIEQLNALEESRKDGWLQ
ncbi:MAG: non-homologous end-joining DNA ligase, partial [Vicinamibacterales bacterium]